ncbi:uncharacterized protein LOC129218963 [Uloborus diversus]|uniref:uncharacterized protein LOC129218963 n=1 Tax=Uloborus diversus TaxID=327109 RepID=UPI00240A867D|nr:uncharacterized protein LOC129218963 [Uloborus diversus]
MDKKMSIKENDKNGVEANGHVKNSSNMQKESKQALPQRKVYTHRNSVLTDLMEVNHLQTVYNISVAVCTLLLINAAIYYLSEPEMFWKDTLIMRWAVSKLDLFVGIWILLQLFAYFIYAGFTLWLHLRNRIFTKAR